MMVPRGATYRTSKCRTTIDYFLVSTCLCNKVPGCHVLGDFPLKPHSPVQLECKLGELEWVPVLDTPIRLPTEKPFGPVLEEASWRELAGRVEDAHQYITKYRGGQWENVQVLGQVYGEFASAFEDHICRCTDTPRRRISTRGRPPRIRWVEGSRRAKRQLKSWRFLDRPLVWMTHWAKHVIRYIADMGEDTTVGFLSQDLEECPTEFRSVEALIGLHQRAQTLIQALAMDETYHRTNTELNETAFRDFLGEVTSALEHERRQLQAGHLQSWKAWVREAAREHRGWAHRWSTIKEQWKPLKVAPGGAFTGRPLESLQKEHARLTEVWGCSEKQDDWFQADAEEYSKLQDLTVAEFQRAARSFSRKAASTWDGFHPRHYCLLGEAQVEVVLELVALVERVGVFPTTLQAIYAKLIPKLKAEADVINYRGIGLLPSLYRLWARIRREEARRWEEANRSPLLGHQAGISIMDVVFLQALRAESAVGEDKVSYTGALYGILRTTTST